jgi:hypothetical protein
MDRRPDPANRIRPAAAFRRHLGNNEAAAFAAADEIERLGAKFTAVCRGPIRSGGRPMPRSSQSALPRGRNGLTGMLLAPFRAGTPHVIDLRLTGSWLVRHAFPIILGWFDLTAKWYRGGAQMSFQLGT